MSWVDEITDEMAELGEHAVDAAPIVWARSLARDLGTDAAIAAVLDSGAPPAVRQIALEDLAR